ncbi:hypothetical protein Pcinc_021264 [Petrolisthes cinctipes]|uniref:Uncharacterized protein n=1 Tax=Petrolisthes cinctipes TaxID=88211 RepID=A0AAE1KIN6_PETCI|nr:hypothetical protein Pcinc_021264 [Petrolisthes cinctipes]
MAKCKGVNPPNQEWSPEGGRLPVHKHRSGNSCSQPGAKRIALLSFGLHQQGREGDLDNWASQDLHTHRPGFCALERSLQCRCPYRLNQGANSIVSLRQTDANNNNCVKLKILTCSGSVMVQE